MAVICQRDHARALAACHRRVQASSGSTWLTLQARVGWSDEEEGIYAELCEVAIRQHLWEIVKADGRLVHRKCNGITMHIGSVVSVAFPIRSDERVKGMRG